MIRFFLILILLSSINLHVICQNQNNQWYFGGNAAIDFNAGFPVSVQTSAMLSIEGGASVADDVTGSLLFYTNGLNVWNANNLIMLNGGGLLGAPNNSSTQGVLIAKYPQNPGKYFIFTTDETNNNGNNGLRYSVVDMTLDGGLGGIVTNQKNIFLQSNTTERIVLAQSFDGNGFWLITSIRNSNQFVVFKITSAGINPVPVISSVGLINSTTPQTNGDETMGQLKINSQNNKLAVALYGGNKIQISDFDNCNGVISNSTVINTGFNPYGLEFSPNGSKLYYSQYNEAFFTGQVFQLNLTASNIQSSNQLVGNSSSINFQCVGSLQLAPDNKIYIAINGESWLSAINFPDNSANTCGFVDMAVNLISPGIFPTPCYFGLPPKILSLAPTGFIDNSLSFSSLCQQDTIEIELLNLSNVLSANWNFGDPNSGINNFSTNINTNHYFTSNGTFFISAEVVTNCGVFNYDSIINVVNCSQSNITGIKINGDTCDANNPIDFQALGTSSSPFFFWNFGDPASGTNDTITITGSSSVPFSSHLFSSPGVYTICVSFQEPGSALETICRTVNIGLCCNAIVIANDSCVENSVTFSFNSVATINSLIWNFDDVQSGINNNSNLLSPSHIFSNAGNYNVTLTINATCGVFTVNFPISIIDCSNTSNCTGLIEINNNCFEAPSLFEIISADTIFSVLWNFGDTASGINNISTNIIGEHLFTTTGSFTINATVFTSCDTFLINTSIIIINCEEPTCTALISSADSCLQNEIQFQIVTNNVINNVQWNFGDIASLDNNTSLFLAPKHIFSQAQTFEVQAIINFDCGIDTITKQIEIVDCNRSEKECIVYVPNAFTPDNSGQNDFFYPRINCTPIIYEFSVFNRWGERIFNSIVPNVKWEGNYKNAMCSSGVYTFFVVYQFQNEAQKIIKGNINLIR